MAPITDLYQAIRRRECVLFLGAGVHHPPPDGGSYTYPATERPPLGNALSVKLADECLEEVKRERANDVLNVGGLDPQQKELREAEWKLREHRRCQQAAYLGRHRENLQRISWYYEVHHDRKILVEAIESAVDVAKRPSLLVRALAELDFPIVMTTNYDRLYETALTAFNKNAEIRIYDPAGNAPTKHLRSSPKAQERWLFKMHGCISEPSSIVITDEDYINFVMRMSDPEDFNAVPQSIRARFKDWPTLFVGYSLLDYNLRLLFRTLRRRVDPADRPATFSLDPYPDMLVVAKYGALAGSGGQGPLVWFIEQDIRVRGENDVPLHDSIPEYLPSLFTDVDSDERVALSCEQFLNRLKAIASSGASADQPKRMPLLIFDQFEELVTLFEENPRDAERYRSAHAARLAIEQMLRELLLGDKIAVKIVFAFRDDYLARLTPLFAQIPNLLDQRVLLLPPAPETVSKIVRGPFLPAEDGQRGLPGHFPTELDEIIAGKIAQGVSKRRFSSAIILSEVQTLCLALWRDEKLRSELRLAADPGPVLQRILEFQAKSALKGFHVWDRVRAIGFLSNLVTKEGTRDVVSQENLLSETARLPAIWAIQHGLKNLLQQLPRTGLVRRSLAAGNTYYELTSEFLIPWIQQRQRKLRNFTLGLWVGGGAIVLATALFWTYRQLLTAEAQRHQAQMDRTAARNAEATATDAKNAAEKALRAETMAKDEADKAVTAAHLALREAQAARKTAQEATELALKRERETKESKRSHRRFAEFCGR